MHRTSRKFVENGTSNSVQDRQPPAWPYKEMWSRVDSTLTEDALPPHLFLSRYIINLWALGTDCTVQQWRDARPAGKVTHWQVQMFNCQVIRDTLPIWAWLIYVRALVLNPNIDVCDREKILQFPFWSSWVCIPWVSYLLFRNKTCRFLKAPSFRGRRTWVLYSQYNCDKFYGSNVYYTLL